MRRWTRNEDVGVLIFGVGIVVLVVPWRMGVVRVKGLAVVLFGMVMIGLPLAK